MKKVIVCLVIALFAMGCGPQKGKTTLVTERHTVGRVDLRDVMTQTGEIRPVVKIDLKCEASGRISKVYIKEGARVNKGDTLLTIDPQRLLIQKERTSLSLERAKIEFKKSQRNFDEIKAVESTGTVSRKQLDELMDGVTLSELSVKQQQLDLKDILDQLGKTIVTSPMSGVITLLSVEEGEIAVSATSGFQAGTAIGTIANISRLEVISQIGEVDYVHLSNGQKVVIKPQAAQDRVTSGTITFVALSAKKANNQDLGYFEVRVAVDSVVPGLAPGINVSVEFPILDKKNVIGVPSYYVEERKGKSMIRKMVKEDGKEQTRPFPVKVGATDYSNVEILEGLSEGDVIVYEHEMDPAKVAARTGMAGMKPPRGGTGGARGRH